MDEAKAIALHETLAKLKRSAGLGVASHYNFGNVKTKQVDGQTVREDGLPNNPLYHPFVREGTYDPKTAAARQYGDGRVIKRNFDDDGDGSGGEGDGGKPKQQRKREAKEKRKAEKKAAKVAAKRQAKLEEKRRAKLEEKRTAKRAARTRAKKEEGDDASDGAEAALDAEDVGERATAKKEKKSKDKKKRKRERAGEQSTPDPGGDSSPSPKKKKSKKKSKKTNPKQ